jgi:hypothetical protein
MMAGYDDNGPQLYQIDPSGSYFAWKASGALDAAALLPPSVACPNEGGGTCVLLLRQLPGSFCIQPRAQPRTAALQLP